MGIEIVKKSIVIGKDKVISFQYMGIPDLTENLVIRCPSNGNITGIFAFCTTAGTVDTEMKLEKSTKASYNTMTPIWTNILSTNLFIRSGKLVDDTNYILNNSVVEIGDVLRVNLVNLTDIRDLGVQVIIKPS